MTQPLAVQPETRFATLGGDRIAYQELGDGPIDLVYMSGIASNVDLRWDDPSSASFLRRLASFSRLILFDRRGIGASDPLPPDAAKTWEPWADDLRAVLDAAGSERAAIFAVIDSGPVAIMFAASCPDRTASLVLGNTSARYLAAPDYPGFPPEVAEGLLGIVEQGWGTEGYTDFAVPSRAHDEAFRRRYARYLRASAAPREAAVFLRHILFFDVRHLLPLVQVPALVLHRSDFRLVSQEQARWLAGNIPGARFVEVPGADGTFYSEGADDVVDLVEEFLTGARGERGTDRVFATVLLTDIVASTERVA